MTSKEVLAQGKAEVPSTVVGEMVMERLRALDHIAYIRAASVYRAFADVDELERELERSRQLDPPGHPARQMPLLPDLTPAAEPKRKKPRRPRAKGSVVMFPSDEARERKAK